MISESELMRCCSMAATAYVCSSLFTAVVRWFHTCDGTGDDRAYYYPGRIVASIAFLLPLLLLPYAWNPSDDEAWLLSRAFFPIVLPTSAIAMLLAYFGSVKQWHRWRAWVVRLCIPVACLILILFAHSVIPGYRCPLGTHNVLKAVITAIAALSTAGTVAAVLKLVRWTREAMEDDYSNEDDFPIGFARRIVLMTSLVLTVLWVGFAIGNRGVMAIIQLIMTVVNVLLLLMVLPTHRHRPIAIAHDEDESEPNVSPDGQSTTIPQERVKFTTAQVRAAVEEGQLYLKPHLTLQDVVERCTFGRTYVSHVLKSELGGFFNYINRLRLEHAERYRAEHPDALLDEVATASGFTSRQAMSNVRRRMRDTTQY
ncbi:MAG: hypothetical protein IJU62_04470 [Muribaculaceae bacterium]|nr:hypothetical protein [Muribaculaceae bacterium]